MGGGLLKGVWDIKRIEHIKSGAMSKVEQDLDWPFDSTAPGRAILFVGGWRV